MASNSEVPPAFPVEEGDPQFPPGASSERPKTPKKGNGELAPTSDLVIPLGESAHSLVERDLPQPVRLCNPWCTEGLNLIAGRPKLGKTTLERQKMAAAATASEFLDSSFHVAVKCAFLSLEEGEALCRSKFIKAGFPESALASIQLHFEWPRGDLGAKTLDAYLTENPDIKLVCIDSLSRFRVVPDARTPAFQADYEAMTLIHNVAKKHPGVCIDVIHHTRKMKSDDPIDDISGTYGLSAVADTCIVLRHYSTNGAMMFIASRVWDREDTQFTLQRGKNHTWEFLGAHLDLTDAQKQTLELVKASPVGLSGKELSATLSITVPSAWQRLDELLEKGMVTKKFGKVYSKT